MRTTSRSTALGIASTSARRSLGVSVGFRTPTLNSSRVYSRTQPSCACRCKTVATRAPRCSLSLLTCSIMEHEALESSGPSHAEGPRRAPYCAVPPKSSSRAASCSARALSRAASAAGRSSLEDSRRGWSSGRGRGGTAGTVRAQLADAGKMESRTSCSEVFATCFDLPRLAPLGRPFIGERRRPSLGAGAPAEVRGHGTFRRV